MGRLIHLSALSASSHRAESRARHTAGERSGRLPLWLAWSLQRTGWILKTLISDSQKGVVGRVQTPEAGLEWSHSLPGYGGPASLGCLV